MSSTVSIVFPRYVLNRIPIAIAPYWHTPPIHKENNGAQFTVFSSPSQEKLTDRFPRDVEWGQVVRGMNAKAVQASLVTECIKTPPDRPQKADSAGLAWDGVFRFATVFMWKRTLCPSERADLKQCPAQPQQEL